MKKLALAALALAVVCLGAHALFAAPGGDPGPSCYVDPNLQCLDYVDPVVCIKPGEGPKWYANACYALKDCALTRTCQRTGS